MDERLAIVDADASSLDDVIALLQAQLREHHMATPEHELRAVAETVVHDARHGFMLLAMSGDRAVGIAYAAAHLSAEHGGLVGWLEELYVAPQRRGRGIGAQLLDALVARARRLGWRAVELEVVAGHERAAALYLRHGFAAQARTRFTLVLPPLA